MNGERYIVPVSTISFACLIVWSYYIGATQGWLHQIYHVPSDAFGGAIFGLKAVTLFLYSCLALLISAITLLRSQLLRISEQLRHFIVLGLLVPESIYTYELLWHFFYWQQQGFIDTTYSVFHTKLNTVFLFSCIAVQYLFQQEVPTE